MAPQETRREASTILLPPSITCARASHVYVRDECALALVFVALHWHLALASAWLAEEKRLGPSSGL